MSPVAKGLGLLGLLLMAGGGVFYSVSIIHDLYGLYLAGAGLALLLLAAVLGRARLLDILGKRSARLGLGAGAGVLVVLAMVVFLGALSMRHHLRWDLSAEGIHSLAPQSVKVLKGLKKPVEAIAFLRQNQAGRNQIEDLLDQYAFQSREFKYRFVDPDQDPGLAKRYRINEYGTVVLVSGDRDEQVKLPEEQSLTNALIRLTRKRKKVVYFLEGHGERSMQGIGKDDVSSLVKAIEHGGYTVKKLVLATAPRVPADASVVVMAGPEKKLMDVEKQRLAAYLGRGGGVLILVDPRTSTGLTGWLKERGIILGNDMVLDQASRLFNASPAWPLAMKYGDHPITNPLEGVMCYFPGARSVSLAAKLPKGVKGVELVKSSPQSWAETDLDALLADKSAKYDKGKDRLGPVSLAAAVSLPGVKPKAEEKPKAGEKPKQAKSKAAREGPAPKGNLVVFGDADFVSNTHLDQAGNRDLVMNSVNFLAQEEDLVSISPKKATNQPLLLQPQEARLVFWIPVVLIPAALILLGLVVVIRRRRPA